MSTECQSWKEPDCYVQGLHFADWKSLHRKVKGYPLCTANQWVAQLVDRASLQHVFSITIYLFFWWNILS